MCVPLAAGLALAGAAVSATGSIMGGIGQSQQLRYQAAISDQNAKLANQQARDSIENTNLEARRLSRDHAQLKGQQEAALAANGVDLSFGSAGDIQRDSAMIYGEDQAQLYKAGNERTKGFEVNAWNYKSKAAGERASAKNAITNGIFGAVGTALGAASQIAGGKFGSGGKSGKP